VQNDYVTRQIRRCNRNLVVTGSCIALFPLSWLILGIVMLIATKPGDPADSPESRSSVVTIVLGLVGVLCCLVPFWRAGLRTLDPKRSPIVRRFQQWDEPDNALASFNGEIAQGLARRIGSLQYTPSWLFSEETFDVSIARGDEIVWLYKLVKYEMAAANISAVVRLRTKRTFIVLCNDRSFEDMQDLVQTRVPWAFFGWDPKLDAMWRNDQDRLIRRVEKRYQKYLSPFGLKSDTTTSESNPDDRIQNSDDGIIPFEPPSPEDLAEE
jgi:hypothetical protein